MADAPLDVGTILKYYHDEVVPALAAALIYDDKFPQEVLNEIRHAFTHLAHAHSIPSEQAADIQSELKAAMQHLTRVCYDSFKVCIMVIATRSEQAIAALTEDLQLPDNVYANMSALRTRRIALSSDEAKKPGDGAIEALKELYNEYDEFYIGLNVNFQGDTAELRRTARKKREGRASWRGRIEGFVIAVVGGILVLLITWVMQIKLHWLLPPPGA